MWGAFDWFTSNFEVTPFGSVIMAMGLTFAFFVLWRLAAIVNAIIKLEDHIKGQGGTDEKVNKATGALSVLIKQSNQ